MIINEKFLREYSNTYLKHNLFENYDKDFNYDETYDIFISHSSLDNELTTALYKLFVENGFKVYLDKEDKKLNPNNVTFETADILRKQLSKCKCLAFVSTSNTYNSKWCPWELGFFDGKSGGKCCILPITNDSVNKFDGQEYLGIYPFIDYAKINGSENNTLWVNDPKDANKYDTLKNWIKSGQLTVHK